MERKEYDLLVNMLSNPTSSFDNLITSGLSINNTSLQDRSVYENDDWVREQFQNQYGEFDKARFDAAYNNAKVYYNYLSLADYNESVKRLATFHRSNMMVEPEKRRQGPEFVEMRVANPYHITQGVVMPGLVGERTQSIDELMLANKVLLNPTTAGDNLENAKWGDSPNDNFTGYFFDTLVMAQYDTDGTHKDLMTGEIVLHKAGDFKLDDTGNFYYERLDGRDIYNKRVLNKMNVLTTDGSWANKLDFFDSDDIRQKSAMGSIMKNVALVGSMFLPYVGTWIAGISIATLLAGLLGTIGKMSTMNSNNSTFSALEGWSKSVSRLGALTEYASEHPWCLENMINLVGDVFGQLRELRVIFEKVPTVFKGGSLITEANQAERLKPLIEKHNKLLREQLATLEKNGVANADLAYSSAIILKRAIYDALREMDSFIKGYNKLGEVLSRGYMTAITVGDTYGEAKAAGASDMDATLLTLGYAIGEYQLLRTGLGRWNLPETRLTQYRNEAIARAVLLLLDKTKQSAFQTAKEAFSNLSSKEGKRAYVHNVLKIGKNLAKDVWTASKSNGTKTLAATLNSAAAEGVEEVSEEILADFSKGCYDVVKWLQGEDTRLNTFGYDFTRGEWNGAEIRDRYLLSLVGGAVGGGLTNVVTNYNTINDYNGMTNQQAIEQIIWMARNGGLDEFMRDASRINLDDPNLSTNFERIDGQVIFDPGTKENNRDLTVKRALLNQINIIQNILAANGAVSDNRFLDAQTLGDARFNVLLNSTTAGSYIQEYNTLLYEILSDVNTLNELVRRDLDTNNDGVTSDSESRHNEVSETTLESINKLEKRIKEKKQKLDDLVSGKRSVEFIATALWETSTFLSSHFTTPTFPLFVEQKYGKKFQDLTDEEKALALDEYEKWKTTEGRDQIRTMAMSFLDFEKAFSNLVKNHEQTYIQTSEELRELNQSITYANSRLSKDFTDTKFIDTVLQNVEIKKKNFTDLAANLASDIITILGTEELKLKILDIDRRREEAKATFTEDMTLEEKDRIVNPFNVELQLLIEDTLIENLHSYALTFIGRGFAALETKNLLTNLINQVRERVLLPLEELEEIRFETLMIYDAVNKYGEARSVLLNDVRALEALNNTPLELNLNEFAISLGQDPINITQLIQKLNDSFNETSLNVTNFQVTELIDELNNAIRTMELYRAAIIAARTDNASLNNLFGFNATLNEVAGKVEGAEQLNLAEIDKNVADLFIEDLNINLQKLRLLKRLHYTNLGQKLSKLDRVSTRKDVLLYKRMKYIVLVLDDLQDWDQQSIVNLKATTEGLTLHEALLESEKNIPADREAFERENLAMENAIYDFFLANSDVLTNPEKLSLLINPSKLDLYTNGENLLNEDLNAIDDNAFVWWLASRAALKALDFYFQYKQIINLDAEHPLAPIATLELAIYNNYASIVNGDVFTNFYKALRLAITRDWAGDPTRNIQPKSGAERELVLEKLRKGKKFAQQLFDKYAINFLTAPRYSHIMLTEGIPGSGKSAAVFKLTVELLRKFHPEILQNVVVAHGANPDSAIELRDNVGFDDSNSQTFGREGFMKFINSTWVEYSKDNENNYQVSVKDYTITAENEIRSKLGVNDILNPPSLIIIDEISKFTAYDLDQIDKFAQKYGITVLVAGDFDQSGVVGSHNIPQDHAFDGTKWRIDLNRTNFIRSPKLGVSMRTDNTFKTNNLLKTQAYLHNPDGKLELEYAETEEGLFGDKVIPYSLDVVRDDDGLPTNISSDKDAMTDMILAEVEKMSLTLKEGELINYIYTDKTTKLYNELSQKPYIRLREGGSAQGLEGQYYVIDLGFSYDDNATFLKDLYTGISRALQGSLVIIPSSNTGNKMPNIVSPEARTEVPIKENLSANVIKAYAKRRLDILDKVVTEGAVEPVKPRTVTQQSNPPSTPPQGPSTPPLGPSNPPQDPAGPSTPGGLLPGTNASQIAAAQLAANAAKKQSLLLAISQANSELEIDRLITFSPLQVAIDPEVENAKVARLTELELLSRDMASNSGPIYNELPDILSPNNLTDLEETPSESPLVPLSQPDIEDNDDAPVTGTDIIDDAQYLQLIDASNETKVVPESSAVQQGEVISIDMLLHSFNTFETGVLEGNNREIVQLGTPEQIAARIDSVNGLLKIDDLLGQNRKTLLEYIDIIGDLRDIIFNTENKADIELAIQSYFGLQNIYTTFALKSSYRIGENATTDSYGYFGNGKANPHNKSIHERTLFNGSKDLNSDRVNHKSMVLILGTKENGNLLEIPLLTLSSPFTLLLTKNGEVPAFPEILATFEQLATQQNPNWRTDKDPNLDLVAISAAIIDRYGGVAKYKELIDLFKLFQMTGNFIKYMRDPEWTPAKNLKLLGARVVSKKGYYQLSDGFSFNDETNPEEEWVDLADFAGHNINKFGTKVNPIHNPQTKVTPIFLDTGTIFDGMDRPIVNSGHPFVLVSYDKKYGDDISVIERFLELEKDPSLPKKVALLYILPPKATIGEYLENLYKIIHKMDGVQSIGYFPTTFKLLKALINDSDFMALANDKIGNSINDLVEILNRIPIDASTLELSVLLNETVDWSERGYGNEPMTLKGIFRGALSKLASIFNNINETGETISRLDQEAIQRIEAAAERVGITGIYHHFPIPHNDYNNNGYFIVPNLDNYSLDGKPCKIHGKIDSYTFKGFMGGFISQLIASRNLQPGIDPSSADANNLWRTPDNPSYFRGNSDLSTNPIRNNRDAAREAANRDLNNTLNEVRTKTGINIDTSQFNGKTLKEIKNIIADTINSTPGDNVALVVGDTLFISPKDPRINGTNKVLYHNGQPITDVRGLLQVDGKAEFLLSIDGKTFNAVFDINEKALELIDPSQMDSTFAQTLATIGLTPDNASNYINEGKTMLLDYFGMDSDIEMLFNSQTYEEFMSNLISLTGLDPDPDNPSSVSLRIDMLTALANPLTDMLQLILNDLLKIEESKQQRDCPIPIKITLV